MAEVVSAVHCADEQSFDPELFCVPEHYKGSLATVLLPHGLIIDRVDKLAADILQYYRGRTVHLLCVLKGGSIFFSDLLRALNARFASSGGDYVPYTFDFIKVSSYEGTESTGKVKIDMGKSSLEELAGRDVLFVEDILDTGTTLTELYKFFTHHTTVGSLSTVALLVKRTERSNGFRATFSGFSIPDKFVIGYGLDYNEIFRDMNHIAVISEAGITKYAK
jgi:hypoxanthine phosphoribosyltransferase